MHYLLMIYNIYYNNALLDKVWPCTMTPVDHTQHGANRFFNYYDTPITFFLLSPTRWFFYTLRLLGPGPGTKTDEFLERFQTAVDPHPPPLRMVPISGNHVHAFHTI